MAPKPATGVSVRVRQPRACSMMNEPTEEPRGEPAFDQQGTRLVRAGRTGSRPGPLVAARGTARMGVLRGPAGSGDGGQGAPPASGSGCLGPCDCVCSPTEKLTTSIVEKLTTL